MSFHQGTEGQRSASHTRPGLQSAANFCRRDEPPANRVLRRGAKGGLPLRPACRGAPPSHVNDPGTPHRGHPKPQTPAKLRLRRVRRPPGAGPHHRPADSNIPAADIIITGERRSIIAGQGRNQSLISLEINLPPTPPRQKKSPPSNTLKPFSRDLKTPFQRPQNTFSNILNQTSLPHLEPRGLKR